MFNAGRLVVVAFFALVVCDPCLSAQVESSEDFVIRESLGQTWTTECLRFELTPAQIAHVTAGHELIGPGQKIVPYQLVMNTDASKKIAFCVDLNPFEERRYRFSDSAANKPSTDLEIHESDQTIDLINSQTGISLRRLPKSGAGPVAGIKLAHGGWIGNSQLRKSSPVTLYDVRITARGPVYGEAVCRYQFGEEHFWQTTFRVYSREPVVIVDEEFSTGDDSTFQLNLAADYAPDRLFYRAGNDVVGKNDDWKIDPQDKAPAFVLEPWLHWWERDRQGNWFGMYSSKGSNLVALGALNPGIWIDPNQPSDKRSAARILVTQTDQDLVASFPLRGGKRRWMITVLDQDTALELPPPPTGGRGPAISKAATLPQKFLVKHGDFPLDNVKETTRPWPEQVSDRARPLVSETLLDELRRRLKPGAELLAKFRRSPIQTYDMDETVAYYLATNDNILGQQLAHEAVRLIQIEVDNFYQQNHSPTLGVEPHRRANNLLPAVNLAALMLSGDELSPDQSRRMKSQLAFLADTVTRADFYSPARGYSANPNMTSTVSAFQVRLAGAIPSHPRSAEWMRGGLNELKRELNQWSDRNGGWLEAPHYAVVAYDTLLGCFLAAHLSGQDDVLHDPKMKLVANWLAKMSSPPDVRLNGWRHHLPIGNTYQQETSSLYGHMAVIWRDKDPQFSANMQWMHQQAGSPTTPGAGGFFPTLGGFRTLLLNPGLPTAAPDWKSELFPETGVILRSGFPSRRETQLSLIAGRHHDHYDDDSGSFTLWGKGSLLASDFGYDGVGSIEDHNLVNSPVGRRGVMHIEDFTTTDKFDVVRGTRDGWTRQIAFVKDHDPLGPHYFVINDTLSESAPAKWQIWLTAEQVTLKSQAATVHGRDDIDLDVIFAVPGIKLRTEVKSRKCLAMRPDCSFDGGNMVTQTGLIAETSSGKQILAILFPRLKADQATEVTTLDEGRGFRVRHQSGTDYLFLSTTPFTYHEGELSFEGSAGLIQLHDETVTLALGAAGKIRFSSRNLDSQQAKTISWKRKP